MRRSTRSNRPAALWAGLLAASALGCDSVAVAVTDGCQAQRSGYENAVRMLDGLRARGIDAQQPAHRAASDEARRAQIELSGCLGSG